MLPAPMNRLLCALLIALVGLAFPPFVASQNSFSGVDLLYPELAHPARDAREAIKRDDLRFIAIDRYGKDVPGLERFPRLQQIHGTKFVRQPFRIFATRSQNFSFALRARAYAREYNSVILHHLFKRPREK
jgi:hypothetical protein